MDADDPIRIAERILRPYLTTPAIFGITPDHKFRETIDGLPFRLLGDIAVAIELDRAKQSAERP